ncbi:TIGR02996 domain-containing protein [Gemmata sp. G18]|uniref:TIGR02996 domain-containing protein n=1 Tax=Gemmata palustris TaxID=2822762 RepID=A0ABS5C2Y0_9BACT|nr:TIGR02996 domain-containing protein [Gemmata palustris]MBP3960336.1 TIGR02996 domain-containing protein [Gemmata palustris]
MNEREALLRAICDNPDDDTPRLVFADWLQEHGDEAQAEFIRTQIAVARGSTDTVLKERESVLLAAHGEKWSEPLRSLGFALVAYQKPTLRSFQGIEYRRGFPYGVQINEEKEAFADRAVELFRCAPIQRIAFYHQWDYHKLAACSKLLQVRELSLDRSGYETPELAVFFGSKFLKNLVRLELIADDDNGHLELDGIELLSKTRSLPALRHLDLSHNWCNWESADGTDWIAKLLKGRLVKRLESLWLRSTLLASTGVELLVSSKQLNSVRHLNLSGNCISPRGLQILASSPNLQSLSVLDLRENRYDDDDGPEFTNCPPETRQLLETRFGNGLLLDGEQEPHPLP